jgi:hypothetical protein
MPVLTGGQVLDREGTTVMPDWGGALLEGGLYNVGDHGLIEEAEEPVMGMGPYKYSGVPPNGYKNGIAEKGAYLVDILTGDTYRNTGTKAATVWEVEAPSGGGSGPWTLINRLVWSAADDTDWEVDGLPQTYDDVLLVLDSAGAGDNLRLSDQASAHHWDSVKRHAVDDADEVTGTTSGGAAALTPAGVVVRLHLEVLLAGYARAAPVLVQAQGVGRGASDVGLVSIRAVASQQPGGSTFGAMTDLFLDTSGTFTAGDVLAIYGRGGA